MLNINIYISLNSRIDDELTVNFNICLMTEPYEKKNTILCVVSCIYFKVKMLNTIIQTNICDLKCAI